MHREKKIYQHFEVFIGDVELMYRLMSLIFRNRDLFNPDAVLSKESVN